MPITNRKPMGPEPGTVAHFAASTAPAGWLKCNGAQVSRTAYAALFAAIGTTYGVGDGATTFNLPELRGEFLRALDDGRGVDTSRGLGTAQGDAIRNMTGSFETLRGVNSASGVFTEANSGSSASSAGTGRLISFNAANQVPTAAENRPRNVAMLACIKF